MSEIYNQIVEKYQKEIKDYCYFRLKNYQAAEDCTQEVFLVLFRKMKRLNLTINIQGWLYKTAEREIKAYRRKNPNMLNIDEMPEQADTTIDIGEINLLDELTSQERDFLIEYYSVNDRSALAEKYGLTISALYVRVHRIKEKLKKSLYNNDE